MNAHIAPIICDFCLQPTLTGELIGLLEDLKEAADNGDTHLCWSLANGALEMLQTTPKGSIDQVSA